MSDVKAVPDTRLLKVDKDCLVGSSWLKEYRDTISLVLKSKGLKPTRIAVTPSRRKGFHVRVYLDAPVPAARANMLQWLLGDDCARVDFNRARINAGFDEWSKLFEAPGEG
jgi:hypothetical protein